MSNTANCNAMKDISFPHANDVLFVGHGDHMSQKGRRVGNSYWKMLIGRHMDECDKSHLPEAEKARISRGIVDKVRNQTPPGRFLQLDPKNHRWFDVGDEIATKKTALGLLGEAGLSTEPDPTATPQESEEKPPFWCPVCQKDNQSAKSFIEHQKGKKHFNRLAYNWVSTSASVATSRSAAAKREPRGLLSQTELVEPKTATPNQGRFYCKVCRLYFGTEEDIQNHFRYNLKHAKRYYRQEGIEFDEQELDATYIGMARLADDVDLSMAHDADRMEQMEHDDVVVELALHNYETFHKMENGSATYSMVNGTSAGIVGWATVTFDDVKPAEASDEASNDGHDNDKPLSKGDEEENRMLRLAMLESTGVCVPCPVANNSQQDCDSSTSSSSSSSDDEETYQYEYEYEYEYEDDDDDDEKEEEEEGEEDDSEEPEGPGECPDEVGSSSSGESEETAEDEGPASSNGSWSHLADTISQDGSSLSDPVVVDSPSRESSSSGFSVVDFLE